MRFANRLPEAVEVLRRTARENPRFPQPWLSLAEVHIKQGQNAEAAAAYQHVLTLVPDHIEALRGLGDLALLEGRLDAAASRYGRILEIDPADVGAMTKIGRLRSDVHVHRSALGRIGVIPLAHPEDERIGEVASIHPVGPEPGAVGGRARLASGNSGGGGTGCGPQTGAEHHAGSPDTNAEERPARQ